MFKDYLNFRPLIRSKDVDTTIRYSTGFFWPHDMRVDKNPEKFEAIINGVIQKEISLLCTQYHAPVTIDAGECEDFYLIQYNISGDGVCRSGDRQTSIHSNSMTVLSPKMHSQMKYSDHVIQLCIRLNRSTVESYLENLILTPIKEPLVFELEVTAKPALAALINGLQYIVQQYRINFGHGSYPEWDNAFAKMIIDLLLRLHLHNYSGKLLGRGGNCRPAYIRRLQEYIYENSQLPITLEDLSRLAGVTSRTLHNAFRRYYNSTPMEYVRSVKVQKVHEELMNADADIKITELLTRYSIYNFGRFARLYRTRYGYLPSETIKRRKATDCYQISHGDYGSTPLCSRDGTHPGISEDWDKDIVQPELKV